MAEISYVSELEDIGCVCQKCTTFEAKGVCERETRRIKHCKDVQLLICCSSQMMTIIVENEKFQCHKAILSKNSTFFDAACNGGFAESHTSEIKLVDEKADNVKIFVGWLYTGTVVSNTIDGTEPLEMLLINLWVLGDKLGSPEFQNEIMYLAFLRWDDASELIADEVRTVYKKTGPGSKLRAFIRDLALEADPLSLADYEGGGSIDLEQCSLSYDQNNWIELFGEGGDFVKNFCLFRAISSIHYNPYEGGYTREDIYLVSVPDRSVEDFIKDFLAGQTRSRNKT